MAFQISDRARIREKEKNSKHYPAIAAMVISQEPQHKNGERFDAPEGNGVGEHDLSYETFFE
jgi:hypothetical protein